jgi:3-carboxy-cis,cis-muconate cycloisomerase
MEKSSIPTIALIKQLREAIGTEYGSYVHWGATSQDVMDTALILQLRACIGYLSPILETVIQNFSEMADKHRHTVMAGRTHSQQALPITFGFKVANWIVPLMRHQQRLNEIKPRLLILQFGGAVGTLASLGDEGLKVAEALASELELNLPDMAWHTQRDTLAEFASWLSLVAGSLAKMAQDIILMAQSEVSELNESDDPSRGGSSTMPQKSNPIISEIIIAAARHNANLLSSMHQAMIQEHERATGGWQLEWITLPNMLHLTASALNKALFLSQNLVVNVAQMQANVKASNGLMLAEAIDLALAPIIGRTEAKRLIKEAVPTVLAEKRHLVDVLRERMNADIDWEALKDETNYLGVSELFIDRILAELRKQTL